MDDGEKISFQFMAWIYEAAQVSLYSVSQDNFFLVTSPSSND